MPAPKPFPCPACGENVPARAKSCPHCGACEKSGWGDDSGDGLDLPDENFDYDKFVAEEFGTPRKTGGLPLIWKVTAIVLLIATAIFYIGGFLFR